MHHETNLVLAFRELSPNSQAKETFSEKTQSKRGSALHKSHLNGQLPQAAKSKCSNERVMPTKNKKQKKTQKPNTN